MSEEAALDRESLRTALQSASGRELVARLDAAAETPALRALLQAEFPSLLALSPRGSRRRFLSLLGASLGIAGLAGPVRALAQTDDRGRIVPYVRQPTDVIPSAQMLYSSATVLDGLANGAWVTSRNGRPIKVEGNPDHPWNRGGTDIFMQASVYDLYDPDRSQAVLHLNRPSDWASLQGVLAARMEALRAQQGQGLRLLTPPLSSPSLLAQIAEMRKAFPEMRWHSHTAVGRASAYAGTKAAFGRALETRWNFQAARVVVAIDGDFLDVGPLQAGVSRDWIAARHHAAAEGRLLALHAAAATPGLTSAKADHAAVVPAAAMASLVQALAHVARGGALPADAPAADWVRRAGQALQEANGASIVTVGAFQAPELQAAVHRLNADLGNLGKTVFHTQPVLASGGDAAELAEDMRRGKVDTLLMLDVNPTYATPATIGFADALRHVPFKLHAGGFVDETARRCDWHVPLSHPLESWGDPRAPDGTVTLMQPVIRRLYEGRSMAEILSLLNDPRPQDGLTLLRAHWQADDSQWRHWLLAGFIEGTALPAVDVSPQPGGAAAPAPAKPGLRALIRPDPTIWDGSRAGNGWLQELPKPLTKVTWDNFVAVSPRVAAREKIGNGDIVRIGLDKRFVYAAAWIMRGQADDALTLTLGYGRRAGTWVGEALGYDALQLPDAFSPWEVEGVSLQRAEGHRDFATTQERDAIDGSDVVRVHGLDSPKEPDKAFSQPDFFGHAPNDGRSWGMVIDLDACIGCNACVVACQAENNIPIVGPEQIRLGRAMHWLRVDRYDTGPQDPRTHFMPVPCMHCENAPCELGCPVEATLHDHEGLNLQVYNRCIGTRACSGYCPYKVRRFNYLDYTSGMPASLEAQRNPQVTVRARGVMEKCTYCVQRIVTARIASDRENRPIGDGEVKTACQQACPTRAITFGDMLQKDSAVAKAKRDPRNYALLGELNTRPHTTYLAVLAPANGSQNKS